LNAARLAVVAVLLCSCASQKPAPVEDRRARAPERSRPQAQPAQKPAADGQYTVKRGDTLYSIALENGADYRELAQWNDIDDPAKIRVGQVLKVKPPETQVQVSRARMPEKVETRPLDSSSPPPKVAPAPSPEKTVFMWPARGKVISPFSEKRNKGIDIDGRLGDPVVAAAAGRVTYVGTGIPGLGKLVVIKHDNAYITVYAHNRDVLVKEQQSVSRGQKIAELGNSDADRPKLHFQIRKGSAPVDPMLYLPPL
jgi:lipoprotein NlpD